MVYFEFQERQLLTLTSLLVFFSVGSADGEDLEGILWYRKTDFEAKRL